MNKEFLRNSLVTVVLATSAAFGAKALDTTATEAIDDNSNTIFYQTHVEQLVKDDKQLNDFQKAGVTFLISSEILAVTLFGYRMSDGARTQTEKYGWLLGIPSTNFVGATILLAEMWR